MAAKAIATITSKGQITLPVELRRQWGLRAGDQIAFEVTGEGEGRIEPRRRRSILDRFDELALPRLGRSVTQADIDASIEQAVHERQAKIERSGDK